MFGGKNKKKKFSAIKFGDFNFHQIESDEWKSYRRLYLDALKNSPTIFPDTYNHVKKYEEKDWKEQIEQFINDNRSILLGVTHEPSNDLVGILLIRGDSIEKMSHIAELYGLYMLHKFDNKEIEKQLLQTALKYMKQFSDIKKIHSAVVTTDREAIALYNEMGFLRYGYDQGRYKIGRTLYDSILISKVL